MAILDVTAMDNSLVLLKACGNIYFFVCSDSIPVFV